MSTCYSVSDIEQSNAEVVILCSAYNQEDYITDALNSFLKQKTSFEYIVLVHDDASTDNTPNIIKEYTYKYPDIIKGIFESENQFQIGRYQWYLPYLKRAKAKYLAFCEGDDYWIDSTKLQSQYDVLEGDEHGVFCFTNALKVDAGSGKILGKMLPSSKEDEEILSVDTPICAEDIVRISFIPAASLFARIDAWLMEPDIPKQCFSGDRAHQMFLSIRGNSYYINTVASAYRVGRMGSLTTDWKQSKASRVESIRRYIALFDFFNSYTEGRFRHSLKSIYNDKMLSLMFATADRSLLSPREAFAAAGNRGILFVLCLMLFYLFPSFVSSVWEKRFSK